MTDRNDRLSEIEAIRDAAAAAEPPTDPGEQRSPFGDERDDVVARTILDADEALDELDAAPIPTLPDGLPVSDAANADRLIAEAGDRIRYVHAWGRWLVWDGTRWEQDPGDTRITETAKVVGRRLAGLFPKVPDDRRKRFLTVLRSAESAAGIAAAIRLARGTPGILVDHHDLDADPWLLNVENGTVDLRTGTLRAHDPADLLTKRAPVRFDPDAEAPTWEGALATWFPEPELRTYAQRLAGYTLVGDVGAEILALLYGAGANGKTKFVEAVAGVAGDDYSTVAHKSLLVVKRHDEHPTAFAQLLGIRLVHSGELDHGARLNEASIKNLTGGDTITARRMREDPWTFSPTHTIWLHTNHLPEIAGQDEGIWRRIRVLPFTVTIPAEERDPFLGAKLAAERSGILNWILAGITAWQTVGLDEPDAAQHATDAYRRDMDTFGRFCAATGIGFDRRRWISTGQLRDLWKEWAGENGEGEWSVKANAGQLRAGGARPEQRGNVRGWRGIGLDENVQETL